jgi:DNA-directed RNA polymerase specialized sigma24 family protein
MQTLTPAKKTYANDGSLESVQNLLTRLAGKCYRRVAAMGLSMEFDDVLQEMRLSYVKAKAAWKPDGGSRFSTYCQTACINNFNNAIRKMESERAELGMVSINAFSGEDIDGAIDPMEIMLNAAGDKSDLPEARLEGAQELQRNLKGLSPGAMRLVNLLFQAEQRGSNYSTSLRLLSTAANLKGDELVRVKAEIEKKFGVKW